MYSMEKNIGFVGLGIMGMPMVRNLMKAGFEVTVYNRTASKVDRMVTEGAKKADSPQEVARKSSIIITMVSDTPDVESVTLGENGIIEGIKPDSVVIDMSTISPQATRKMAERLKEKKAHMLDAPVAAASKARSMGHYPSWSAAMLLYLSAAARCLRQWGKTLSISAVTVWDKQRN
jgi:3-hydroxyisobutyrate dehydrogenase-like beta-hydroxyacid dehydrogenase